MKFKHPLAQSLRTLIISVQEQIALHLPQPEQEQGFTMKQTM